MKIKLFSVMLIYICLNFNVSNENNCINQFKKFAINCKPVYYTKTDTFDVAAIPVPNKRLNKCLLKINKSSHGFEEIKEYAFLVIMKVLLERLINSKTAYYLSNEHNKYTNAIEKICLDETQFKKFDLNRDSYQISLTDFYNYLKSKPNNYIKLQELKDLLIKIDKQYDIR